jgi:hypothetical protein
MPGGEPQTETVVTEKKPADKQIESFSSVPAPVSAEKSKIAPPQTGKDDPWGDVFDATTTQAGVVAEEKAKDDIASETNFPPENYDPESAAAEEKGMQSMNMNEAGNPVTDAGQKEKEQTVPVTTDYFLALEKARRLHWEGKTGLARAAYERLMFEYQDFPEVAAELGNLLLQNGNQNGATWAFESAISRYINLHREQEAISIIRVISQYDPAMAEKLQKKYW